MPRLIFDIETVGVEFDSLDDKAKEFLLFWAESPEEIENVKNRLGFSPLTGEVVAIAILNPDTDKGAVYFQAGKSKMEKTEDKNAQYIPLGSEKEAISLSFFSSTTFFTFIAPFILFTGKRVFKYSVKKEARLSSKQRFIHHKYHQCA